MAHTLVISDEKLEEIIDSINNNIFTALDFAHAFKSMYQEDWVIFTKRYGNLGDTGRYGLLDYFANRLEYYSQKRDANLMQIPRFSSEGGKFFRDTTEEEQKFIDLPKVMLFHKK